MNGKNEMDNWPRTYLPDSIKSLVELGSFQFALVASLASWGTKRSIVLVHMVFLKEDNLPCVALLLRNTCADDELTRCDCCDQV
jgi:hypothetical protein